MQRSLPVQKTQRARRSRLADHAAGKGQGARFPLRRLTARSVIRMRTVAATLCNGRMRRKRSHDHTSGSGSIRPKSEPVSPSKGPESGRLTLP